ncbi:hypothetical protein [Rhodospirillum sp. A1_3_36]|uniref:hypothetical protein n=1 Tax=Rhodospirillum sp. A1_3_36 TaxID=3391666 RepID=UPI0039A765FA
MNAVIIYPAVYHGETRVVHSGGVGPGSKVPQSTSGSDIRTVAPLQDLREASLHMEQALEQVRDVVDRLNADQVRAGDQAACLGYLSGALSERMGDLRRETESFVSFLRS